MEWACTECGRTYHEPPDTCPICGHDVLVPRDEGAERRASESYLEALVARLRGALLDPGTIDRGLLTDSPAVTTLFRLLVVASGLLFVLAVLALVL